MSDVLHGQYTGAVDDFVLQRNDGTPAYNLAVVVDDAAGHIDQVVRGDDLASLSANTPYEQMPMSATVRATLLRGIVTAQDGQVTR